VLSVSYLAPDTPRSLTQLLDIVTYCRVAVFQIAELEELPRYLKELLETSTIKKTGKVELGWTWLHVHMIYSLLFSDFSNIEHQLLRRQTPTTGLARDTNELGGLIKAITTFHLKAMYVCNAYFCIIYDRILRIAQRTKVSSQTNVWVWMHSYEFYSTPGYNPHIHPQSTLFNMC
jgi:hypothetical protein